MSPAIDYFSVCRPDYVIDIQRSKQPVRGRLMVRDLSHSDLRLVSGGLSAVTMSLAALTSVAGYIGGRYALPPPLAHRVNGVTATGASLAAIGCGLATHSTWTNPRFSPNTQLQIGTTASVLCGTFVAIGESVVEELSTPHFLDDDWAYT